MTPSTTSSTVDAGSTTGPSSTTSPGATSWTTYGGGNARLAAADTAGGALSTPVLRWRSPSIEGLVYAQPLLTADRVVIGTEANVVAALDRVTGAVVWRAELGTPVDGRTLPCGNISPSGITGTPVIDEAGGTVYAVAFLASGPRHELVALDLATGSVRWRRTVDPPGLSAKVEQQRGALALANGRVYVPFGGLFGDCGPYKGAVVSSDPAGTGALQTYIVPTTREGGIWAPPGPAVASDGSLFVTTGNTEGSTTFDGGNAVVRLSPDLRPQSFYAPADWVALNRGDVDLGSVSPVLLPSGRLFVAGKSGIAYLLDPGALGGVGGPTVAQAKVCATAIGGAATTGDTVVLSCLGEVVGLSTAGDHLSVSWRRTLGRPGPPVIAHQAAWVVDGSGVLHALRLADGTDGFTAPLGGASRFASVAAAGADIVVAGGGRVLSYTVR